MYIIQIKTSRSDLATEHHCIQVYIKRQHKADNTNIECTIVGSCCHLSSLSSFQHNQSKNGSKRLVQVRNNDQWTISIVTSLPHNNLCLNLMNLLATSMSHTPKLLVIGHLNSYIIWKVFTACHLTVIRHQIPAHPYHLPLIRTNWSITNETENWKYYKPFSGVYTFGWSINVLHAIKNHGLDVKKTV